MKLKRILGTMVLAIFVITFIPVNAAFASTNPVTELEIEPTEEEYLISDDGPGAHQGDTRAIRSFELTFKRANNTKAIAEVKAYSTKTSPSMSSTIYLQKYNDRTKGYLTVKGIKSTKRSKSNPITHRPSFAVSKKGNYRVKAVVTDSSGSKTKYCGLF